MPDLPQEIVKMPAGMPQQAGRAFDSASVIDNFSSLANYLDMVLKHRALILAVALIVAALVTIYSFKVRPVYRATARVEIESETPLLQSLTDLFRGTVPVDEETFLSTQVAVLKSDSLAWLTIEQLKLAEAPEFKAVLGKDPGTAQSATALQTALTNEFEKRLIVVRKPDTRMLSVQFDSTDPRLAAAVANAMIENYIEYNFRLKYDATRQATAFLEKQLDELKAKVEKSQQALVDYERQNSIVSVGEKESVAEQKLADLSKDLTDAQNERLNKESLWRLVNSDPSQVRFVAQSELLQKLQATEADLHTQYADAAQLYGTTFPKVKRLQAQLDEVQSLTLREQKRLVGTINHDYAAAKGREDLLSRAVAAQKVEVGRFDELLIEHNLLKRDADSNQQLYDSLLQRLKDATVSAGLRATNIHMIDRALPPRSPDRPKKGRDIAIGLLVGLILGLILALVREGLDNSIKGAEEVERITGLPALAIVPMVAGAQRRLLRGRHIHGQSPNGTVALAMLQHPESPVAESFRGLRTSVLLSTADRPPQAILVTSPQPSEGKTCTALNLAIALAQRGPKVLILDADFRRPGIARELSIGNKQGLSTVLTGAATASEVICQFPGMPALWVLPTGPRPPNPAELLSSTAMENLLKELRSDFNFIVIDSPPVVLITDATILASIVDGVVLIVESEKTTRGAMLRAFRTLSLSGGKLLGTVLNKVDSRRDGYYGHYNYYYYYRQSYEDYYAEKRV
jgi:capsular exopolysaccharide synthesis family protein